jgi:hypothetical protein
MSTMGPEERERFARREEVSLPRRDSERQKSIKLVAGGSITEAICGAAVVVLAIIGLTGMGNLAGYMASIATIAFGVALLAQGGAVAARWSRLLHDAMPSEWESRTELGGGMGAEFLAGGAGVVMGVLGVLGMATATLIPIAIIVFGGALLLGSGSTVELGSFSVDGPRERFADLSRQAAAASSGAQVLLGIAAIVLGIIALVGIDPVVVTLVALLVLGASVLFSGTAISSRMASVLHRG